MKGCKRARRLRCCLAPLTQQFFGGTKVYTKGVLSSENSSPLTGKKEVWCIPKSLFSREKKENAYTPKSLQGVCGGPLRAVLVYRFWPPSSYPKHVLVPFLEVSSRRATSKTSGCDRCACFKGYFWRAFRKGEAFLFTVGAFLLTVRRLCLQSLKALLDAPSHCK